MPAFCIRVSLSDSNRDRHSVSWMQFHDRFGVFGARERESVVVLPRDGHSHAAGRGRLDRAGEAKERFDLALGGLGGGDAVVLRRADGRRVSANSDGVRRKRAFDSALSSPLAINERNRGGSR